MIGQQAVMAVMTWYVQTGSVNAYQGCNPKHGMFISSLGIQTLSQVPTFLSTSTEYYWYTAHWVKCQLHTCSWHVCMYNTESDYFMFILYINFARVALVIQIAYSNHAMPPPQIMVPTLWCGHWLHPNHVFLSFLEFCFQRTLRQTAQTVTPNSWGSIHAYTNLTACTLAH